MTLQDSILSTHRHHHQPWYLHRTLKKDKISHRLNFVSAIIQDWEEPEQTSPFQPEEDRAKNIQESTNKPLDITTQSRSANRYRPNSFNLAQLHPAAQQRLFFGAFNPFSSNTNNWLGTFFQSSTLVTVTVPSTLVTAVISTCIPAAQFLAGGSNIACARRRRHIVDETNDQSDQVSPTLVQQLVTPN